VRRWAWAELELVELVDAGEVLAELEVVELVDAGEVLAELELVELAELVELVDVDAGEVLAELVGTAPDARPVLTTIFGP
jgi:hypothetical protein